MGEQGEAVPTHPEEMKGSVELRMGEKVTLRAAGRITPAGIVTATILVATILLSATALVRAAKAPERRRGA